MFLFQWIEIGQKPGKFHLTDINLLSTAFATLPF